MNVKDKIIFGLLIILIAAGGYFQWMADDMKSRMDVLNQNDEEHLDLKVGGNIFKKRSKI